MNEDLLNAIYIWGMRITWVLVLVMALIGENREYAFILGFGLGWMIFGALSSIVYWLWPIALGILALIWHKVDSTLVEGMLAGAGIFCFVFFSFVFISDGFKGFFVKRESEESKKKKLAAIREMLPALLLLICIAVAMFTLI